MTLKLVPVHPKWLESVYSSVRVIMKQSLKNITYTISMIKPKANVLSQTAKQWSWLSTVYNYLPQKATLIITNLCDFSLCITIKFCHEQPNADLTDLHDFSLCITIKFWLFFSLCITIKFCHKKPNTYLCYHYRLARLFTVYNYKVLPWTAKHWSLQTCDIFHWVQQHWPEEACPSTPK